ncbi:hypothetical protein OH407_24605, partial [Salmonella enterica]|uniref:hypothetical protein n=1 Tax=Salmonella enterica TaxID=28901 RepID=UPI0022B65D26
MLLLSSLIAAFSPFSSFSATNTTAEAATASGQTTSSAQVDMEWLIQAAYEEFLSEKGLTEQTMGKIRQKQEAFFA